MYNSNLTTATVSSAAHNSASSSGYREKDFAPPAAPAVATTARGKIQSSTLASGRDHSTTKIGALKLSKLKSGSSPSISRNTITSSITKGSIGITNANKPISKASSGNKSSGPSGSTSRQLQSSTVLDFNTPKQIQMLAQCDFADRTIWATRVLWGGNSVNGFLRATATAQRIKKQRARQNNSTKMSRAAKAASNSGVSRTNSIVDDDKKGSNALGSIGSTNTNTKLNSSLSGTKAKELFNQNEEEFLKKEIMNPRTAKKLKSELQTGLTFCATVCNVLRGVLFDMDPSLSPSLPQHLVIEQEKPPPAYTFLNPSNRQSGTAQHHQLATSLGTESSGSYKATKGGSKSKISTLPGVKAASANKNSGFSKQHQSQEQVTATQNSASSPGDPGNSTLRRFRKTNKNNKSQSVFTEPALLNLPPEFDTANNNKRTCTKKEYQHRIFQLLRYRDLKEGDFCAARLSSRDLWILAKVLKEYKTNNLIPQYTSTPLDFISLKDTRRDALFQKERVVLEDVEDHEAHTSGTKVIRSLVLPLPRSSAEANEWTSRLVKKGSRVYAMYPQTTSLYAATVIDSSTYCRGDDDIIVVQFDGEDADVVTGRFPSYHIPARFVTLIPREFPASQPGRNASSSTKSTSTSSSAPSIKRKLTSVSSGNLNKRRPNNNDSKGTHGAGARDTLSMDLSGGAKVGNGFGGFDDLDLDFDKPLDEHEQATQDKISPF